jgi:PrgI family protein
VAILAVTGLVLYTAWSAIRTVVPLPVFLILAVPIGASAAIVAVGQRDGITLDRVVLAAIRQRLSPRHQVAAPEGVRPAPEWLTTRATTTAGDALTAAGESAPGVLRLPAEGITEARVVDLGGGRGAAMRPAYPTSDCGRPGWWCCSTLAGGFRVRPGGSRCGRHPAGTLLGGVPG